MKFKVDRIISVATLLASLIAIVLVLKRPAPVAPAQTSTVVVQHSAAPDQNPVPIERPQPANGVSATTTSPASAAPASSATVTSTPAAKTDAHVNSDAISGALAKMLGGGGGGLTPDSDVGGEQPVIKDQQVTMDGDVVHGKFLTEIAGKDTWVTISGHMGQKDGYATFDPTEIKVGDTNIPIDLMNPALQRKMAEERDRLKIPNGGSPQ